MRQEKKKKKEEEEEEEVEKGRLGAAVNGPLPRSHSHGVREKLRCARLWASAGKVCVFLWK